MPLKGETVLFSWLSKKLKYLRLIKEPVSSDINDNEEVIKKNIDKNLDKIKEKFARAEDLVLRQFIINIDGPTKATLIYIDGLVDIESIQRDVLKPLMANFSSEKVKDKFSFIKDRVISMTAIEERKFFKDTIADITSGNTVLFIDGYNKALSIEAHGWETRNVTEPNTDVVVRGPHEGFTETLRTNTALLRRKIKNPNLKIEHMTIGKQTKTEICIVYIEGIVNDKIVQEVKNRLSRIKTDSILESGYIEQFIEDAPFSPLPTVGNSEKPDMVAGKILEGRVAILTDGTPFVLTVPYLFIEAFQITEDYYSRSFYTTLIRWIRFLSFLIGIFAPALYVALTTFHQEMIPPALLISMATAQEGVPFPAFIEALMMIIIFEILREAGLRLPRPVGQAVSIVGALVIGDAAVSAGLIGAPMVIVVAITAISSFAVPSINDSITIKRFYYLLLAGPMGLYGIMLGVAGMLSHMTSLQSYGVPYLSPFAPTNPSDFKDVFTRAPWWMMTRRPQIIGDINQIRQEPDLKPQSPKKDKS